MGVPSTYVRDRLTRLGIAVPRARPTYLLRSPHGQPGVVNARPGAHGAMVPPNVSMQNQTNQWGPFPSLYGEFRYAPLYAGSPYQDFEGRNTYTRALYVLGYGKIEVSEFWLGNRKLNLSGLSGSTIGYDARADVHLEVRYGEAGDTPLTLYPSEAVQDANSLTTTNGWQAKQTPVACDEMVLNFTFPNGLYEKASDGTAVPYNVTLQFEYATSDGFGNVTSGWTAVSNLVTQTVGTTALKRAKRIVPGTRSFYIVRCKRVVAQSTNTDVADQCDWVNLTALVNDDPLPTLYHVDGSQIYLAKVAIRALTTERKNQTLDDFSIKGIRHLPVWNGTAFVVQATKNPAWPVLDAYTGTLNKFPRPLAKTKFNLDELLEFANSCDELGFEFNHVLDQGTQAYQFAQDVCAAARANFIKQNGKYTIIQDKPVNEVAQHITPLNSYGMRFSKNLGQLPHALRINWLNPAVLYQQDELIVYNDGYNGDGSGGKTRATIFEPFQVTGDTNAAQAYKLGRFYLAAVKLRPRLLTFGMDFEQLPCNVGDIIEFTHDVLMIGEGFGRLASVQTNGSGDVTGVTLDHSFSLNPTTSYSARIRLSDGSSMLRSVLTIPGKTSSLTFTTPIPAATVPLPQAGDLIAFGNEPSAKFRIIKLEHQQQPHLSATLTCVDYSPHIFDADTEEIGEFTSSIQIAFAEQNRPLPAPKILIVQSNDSVFVQEPDGTRQARIVVTLGTSSDARIDHYEAQFKLSVSEDWTPLSAVSAQAGQISVSPVQTGQTYDVWVRSISTLGYASEYTQLNGYTVEGNTSLPPAPATLDLSNGTLIITPPSDLPSDFYGYLVRTIAGEDANWDLGVPVFQGVLTINQVDVSRFVGGKRVYMVKIVDTAGNESEDACILKTELGDPLENNVVIPTNYKTATFPGTKTGCAVDGSSNLAATTLALAWKESDAAREWAEDPSTLMWDAPWSDLEYICTFAVTSTELPGEIQVLADMIGSGATIEYRLDTSTIPFWAGAPTDPEWTDDNAAFWNAGNFNQWTTFPRTLTAQVGIYQFRFRIPGGAEQPKITSLVIQVDVADVKEIFTSFAVSATTGSRLPLTKTFRVIKAVNVTEFAGSAGARNCVAIDRPLTLGAGPLIKIFDGSNNAVSGTADVTVQGY